MSSLGGFKNWKNILRLVKMLFILMVAIFRKR